MQKKTTKPLQPNYTKDTKNTKKYLKNQSFKYQKDGQSNEGMQTSVWGPILWTFLHIMSFNYPMKPTQEDKNRYKGFVDHIQYILPCKTCRENLPKNMIRAGYGESCFFSRETLSRFFWRLHNEVSTSLNKDPSNKSRKLIESDYNKVAERFELVRAKCSRDRTKMKTKKNHIGCVAAARGQKRNCEISIFEVSDGDSCNCSSRKPSLLFKPYKTK